MEIGRLPSILDFPDKIMPMVSEFDIYRYFLLEGGRGGAKSHSVCRFLLYLGDRYNLRIVCGREIQTSIAESVYSLMVDLIQAHDLNYERFATKLVHRSTGTTISFRGFREIGSVNIQGMEAVDIVFLDESQSISKLTLDRLIPTIRKENAKIIFSMNRHVHDDPVFEFASPRDDCLHIHINYYDNKHCTNALRKEAEECKIRSMEDYNHIWLGKPLTQNEDAVFNHEELLSATKVEHQSVTGYGLRIAGFDVARYGDDKCSVVVLQQLGSLHWAEVHSTEWDHRDLSYTTGRILEESNEHRVDKSIIDEDGIGSAPLDMLNKGRGLDNFTGFRNLPIGWKDNKEYANHRTLNTYKLKEMIRKGYLRINTQKLIKELEHAFRYTYDNYQRRILISKERMRKPPYNQKSPNLADSLIMAVSMIGTINYKQQLSYNRQPAYSREDNLFAGAGIR